MTEISGNHWLHTSPAAQRAGRHRSHGLIATLVGMLLATAVGRQAAADTITIAAREAWSNVFGGQEITLGFHIAGAGDREVRIAWAVSIEKRVVARRELVIAGNPAQPVEFSIRLQLPEAEPTTILAAAVALSIDGKVLLEKPLWIFPHDPFADQRKTLAAAQITLFDPEHKTVRLLERIDIPFQEVRDVEAVARVRDGIVLIGEGISFRDFRGLPEQLVRSAARGNRVLCLAPSAGTFELPGLTDPAESELRALSLRKADVVADFDKRLDHRAWPPDGRTLASGIGLAVKPGRTVGEIGAAGSGWPWLEADFQQDGRIILCGFALVEKWDSGPAPRYVLRHVLERVAKKKAE